MAGIGAVAPLARMRGLVVPDGELGDPGSGVLTGGEVAAAQELPGQDAGPLLMFSQDACSGVWVTLNPRCAVIQARVAFEVWLEPLSMIRWMRRPGAIDWPSISRKLMKVTESLRRIRLAMISPTATFIAAMIETVPCRLYSDSRRASRPGRPGMSGRIRVFAWTPVFSPVLVSTVPGGGFR